MTALEVMFFLLTTTDECSQRAESEHNLNMTDVGVVTKS